MPLTEIRQLRVECVGGEGNENVFKVELDVLREH